MRVFETTKEWQWNTKSASKRKVNMLTCVVDYTLTADISMHADYDKYTNMESSHYDDNSKFNSEKNQDVSISRIAWIWGFAEGRFYLNLSHKTMVLYNFLV